LGLCSAAEKESSLEKKDFLHRCKKELFMDLVTRRNGEFLKEICNIENYAKATVADDPILSWIIVLTNVLGSLKYEELEIIKHRYIDEIAKSYIPIRDKVHRLWENRSISEEQFALIERLYEKYSEEWEGSKEEEEEEEEEDNGSL
jgi:hypothetical protein